MILYLFLLCNLDYAQYINDPTVNDPDEQSRRALFRVMGFGLCFARAAAAAIKFNCALLLIFVLRNFLSWFVFNVARRAADLRESS